jgi:hypothetical protein
MTLEHFLVATEAASPGPWLRRPSDVSPGAWLFANTLVISRAYMLPRLVRLLILSRAHAGDGHPLAAMIDAALADLVKELA